ncbi:hypothetical protein M4E85_000111 [Salmonella enterica]|nr:hypothetical protein [Salmonella enterica]
MTLNETNKLIYTNNILSNIHIDIDIFTMKYNLLLILSSDERIGEEISIHFYDVSNLKLVDIGGGLTQLMHLRISETNYGSDRNRFIIEDLDDGKLQFEFYSFDTKMN